MKDIFNFIHEMIYQYEKATDEKPYIILVSPNERVRCAFNDEYNEKRDMTPVRELKIHQDKIGKYVIHKHQRYYLD